jgi:hypothetical protein
MVGQGTLSRLYEIQPSARCVIEHSAGDNDDLFLKRSKICFIGLAIGVMVCSPFTAVDKPLQHEVDVISSVSGGSFTSAYYGLRGNRIFDEFEECFLRKNVGGPLLGRVFNPF